jgi:hypothetical protein
VLTKECEIKRSGNDQPRYLKITESAWGEFFQYVGRVLHLELEAERIRVDRKQVIAELFCDHTLRLGWCKILQNSALLLR